MTGVTPGRTIYMSASFDPSDCTQADSFTGNDPFVADASGTVSATLEVGSEPAGTSVGVSGYSPGGGGLEHSPLSACKTVPEGPHVAFGAADYTANENAGSVTLKVVRTGGLESEIKLGFSSTQVAGKRNAAPFADMGVDYSDSSINATIPAGAGSVDVPFALLDDKVADGPKVVVLSMSGLRNGVQVEPSHAEILINDDDPPAGPGTGGSSGGGGLAVAAAALAAAARRRKPPSRR